ncbi:MAG: ferritin-like domain-containing protein [Candidatus Scalindua sp.]|nr:ferritin-like domain-containing protein [Candidatus Scalindua sp.]
MSKLSRKLLLSIKLNHLTEAGATVIYSIQAKLVKNKKLKEKLQRFSREENLHMNELNKIIIKYGSNPLPLAKITKVFSIIFTLFSAIGRQRTILRTDIYLEKIGIATYRRQKELMLGLVDNETIEKYDMFIQMEEGHLRWLKEWKENRLDIQK